MTALIGSDKEAITPGCDGDAATCNGDEYLAGGISRLPSPIRRSRVQTRTLFRTAEKAEKAEKQYPCGFLPGGYCGNVRK